MIDHSQAHDRININVLCNKLKRTELPEQIFNIIEYMCRNTFVNTVCGKQPSEFLPVGICSRKGGITSGFLFNFYINEMLDTIRNLPVGCNLRCSKINILCYADDIVLLTPTAQALQVMLDCLSHTIRSLSLKINVQKSYHIVFRHKNRKIVSDMKIDNQILKSVTECKYLGVVLSDDLSCT